MLYVPPKLCVILFENFKFRGSLKSQVKLHLLGIHAYSKFMSFSRKIMEIDSCGSFRYETQHFCVMLKKDLHLINFYYMCNVFILCTVLIVFTKAYFAGSKKPLNMGSLLKDNYKAMCMSLKVIKLYV